MSRRAIAVLVAAACLLGGCGLPEPYETYPPSTPSAPPPRAANALTVAGATTTTPDNEVEFGTPQSVAAPLVPEPAAPAPTPGAQVAICYNRIWNSADAVRSAAALACGAKSTPQVVSRDFDLNACPVMTPSHAVFACGAAK
ncbi:MAG TPA: hypothetical protein VN766_02425 [Stellaceae bacterium]|jgi:hypothetical protein|nr:hypothetical protein [Stellaceae bacterium]